MSRRFSWLGQSNIKEAQAGYTNTTIPFLKWVEAQRNAVGLNDRDSEAVAETTRRRAALERAVGVPLPAGDRYLVTVTS